jgi:hypothetical protein
MKNFLILIKQKIFVFKTKLYSLILPYRIIKISDYKNKFLKSVYLKSEKKIFKKHINFFSRAKMYTEGYTVPEGFVSELNQINFHSDTGLLTFKSKIILESGMDFKRILKMDNLLKKIFNLSFKVNSQFKNEICTSIIHLPWAKDSNFHWFIDCLSRIYLLQNYFKNKITILVPKKIKKFQLETLKFCIPKNWNIFMVEDNQVYQIDKYVFPSFLSSHLSGYLDFRVIEFMNSKIMEGYKIKKKKNKENIFISRNKANKRKILNENKLHDILKKYNFKIVFSEDLKYKEQVDLFYNSKIIISAHGAGLTNILFSEKATVIELQPVSDVRSHYCLMSLALDHNYHPIYLEAEGNLKKNPNMIVTNKNLLEIENLIKLSSVSIIS